MNKYWKEALLVLGLVIQWSAFAITVYVDSYVPFVLAFYAWAVVVIAAVVVSVWKGRKQWTSKP